jgi:prepilin-type N-terminal cleavage/methylation domain-containing protein
MKKKDSKGFTLIELMIVCGIISLIALFLIPSFLKMREKNKKQKEGSLQTETMNQVQRPVIMPYRTDGRGNLPVFNSENIKIKLSVQDQRIGMEVYNRFEAEVKGEFTLNKSGQDPVRLDFKFPGGTTEAKDVSLKFITGNESQEPEDVIYDREGIFWTGTLPEEKDVKVEIAFTASGRDKFEYSLPHANKTKDIQIDLTIEGEAKYFIPDYTLQPTSVNGSNIAWKFNNLVTDRPIIIDFLEAQSPVGKVILMCKLVGIAVLLFGLGFWYLAALYQIEGLFTFRWGHFLLLALNYSFFFVIFGVLGFRGDLSTETSIVIAAILSLPLLTLHVSRIIDMKFAIFNNLPFSVFTLAMVINGVYGGQIRDYIFLGSACIVVAFITITFKKWALNREKWLDTLEGDLIKRIEDFGNVVTEGKEIYRKTGDILREKDLPELTEMKNELEENRKKLIERFKEYETILLDLSKLKAMRKSGDFYEYNRNSLREKISILELNMKNDRNSIQISMEQLISIREPAGKTEEKIKDGNVYCFTCGYHGEDSPYCPKCGTVRPTKITCRKCNETMEIPVSLIKMELEFNSPGGSGKVPVDLKKLVKMEEEYYCIKCGEKQEIIK